VADWWYIRDTDPPQPTAYWPEEGITVTGTRVPVSIDQVIAAEGPRFPAYPDSRTDFLVPLVLVIRPSVFTQDEVETVEYLCDEWTQVFSRATGWRGSVRCAMHPPDTIINSPSNPPVLIPPGEILIFRGVGDDPDGDAVELSWDFSGVAPGMSGPGPHTVMFPAEGIYDVTLSARDETGMSDPTPATVNIEVGCPLPVPQDEVERLMVARQDDSLRFTWEDLTTNPTEYLLLRSVEEVGAFLPAASAPSGAPPGLLFPEVSAHLIFYEVAGWYEPGCLGPF
jgi:hypothetical protein